MRLGAHALLDVLDDGAVLSIGRLERLALDEHELLGGLLVASGKVSSWIVCARPESPGKVCSTFFVPRPLPITNATITNASHPKMAVLRCWALQRPARAAMPLGF